MLVSPVPIEIKAACGIKHQRTMVLPRASDDRHTSHQLQERIKPGQQQLSPVPIDGLTCNIGKVQAEITPPYSAAGKRDHKPEDLIDLTGGLFAYKGCKMAINSPLLKLNGHRIILPPQ